MFNKLKQKILNKRARIGIIGMGYVGLSLAMGFAKRGFKVWGIDIDRDRIERLRRNRSYIVDIPVSDIVKTKKAGVFNPTTDFGVIKRLDAVIICVPTPVSEAKEPDISFIRSAVESIASSLKRGQIIVLESTTYPGTTEEIILPILEKTGLKEGKDFYLAFSPERIDPGNKVYTVENTPKIVGGMSSRSTEVTKLLYGQIIGSVHAASSSRAAEMVKLLENTFRIVNISLVNEMMLLCDKLDIDIWEVIDLAKTKPYGFMPFYPGPGAGGHCIPVDPLYLSWKARSHGFEARFIDLASSVNSGLPHHIVDKISQALNDRGRPLRCSKILIMGVAYKKDVKDLRESPALEIIDILIKKGSIVSYHDPYLPYLRIFGINLKGLEFNADAFKDSDCVVIVADHSNIDYGFVAKYSPLIIDTRNALKDVKVRDNIIKL
ncbi:MAG: nucleotide sugar dehydrogenase [Candidatus Omnitrophica bacterium]|nr:nucleotide sugar dehydrogenase [Candidatus Omnitrophota bacterium]